MKAHAIFRLGRDAEIRNLTSGDSVANLALATNVRKGKEEVTVWVEAALFGNRADTLAPMLLKGTQIMADLDGVHIETYQGKNGPTSKLVARVVDITLLGKKPDDQGSAPAPRPAPAPAARPAPAFDADSEDIPF